VQGEHPVDTPAQSAARQIIDTNARVTHVAGFEPAGETEPSDDFSLEALVPKKPVPDAKVTVTRTTTAHVSRGKDE
jgi:hypothetical protein